jgi:hypothetical protein
MHLISRQRDEIQVEESPARSPLEPPLILSRATRARYRLDWHQRFARNARTSDALQVAIQLFGIPERFAIWLGLTGT